MKPRLDGNIALNETGSLPGQENEQFIKGGSPDPPWPHSSDCTETMNR